MDLSILPTINATSSTINCGGSVTLTSSANTGNQWYRNTVLINGATSNTYNATLAGNYTVMVSSILTCSATSLPISLSIGTFPTITGATAICNGATLLLSNTLSGGVWSSLNNKASVNATTGVVTGLNAGTASIKYTVTSGNCIGSTTISFTVNAIPPIPAINYANSTPNPQTCTGGGFRMNNTFTVVGTPSGGVWSKTGVMSVGATTGVVNTGSVSGAASLTYTRTVNGCSNFKTINGFVGFCRGVNNGQLTMDNGRYILIQQEHPLI